MQPLVDGLYEKSKITKQIAELVHYIGYFTSVWGHIKFTYEVPNQNAPKSIAVNWTMRSQTEACIGRSQEICALRYYAV
jgi:hypothetical protein